MNPQTTHSDSQSIQTLKNEGKRWLPEKNLFGVTFQSGGWVGLEAEATQQVHETDCITGESLPREEGVHYRTLTTESESKLCSSGYIVAGMAVS